MTKNKNPKQKNGAVKYTQQELQEIITEKQRQFVTKQYNHRDLFLSTNYQRVKTDCWLRAIKKAEEGKLEEVSFISKQYPIELAKINLNLEANQYIMSEQKLAWGRKELLKAYHMTKEQLDDLEIHGKLLKNVPEGKPE